MTVREARPVSHRRRIFIGLALAALAGVVLLQVGLVASRSAGDEETARRLAIVRVQALVQALDRAGIEGDAARAVVRGWAASDTSLHSIRVIAFTGISLEASTAPEDAGDRAAPRRLDREEKPLYDQGQRLRAAAETNRDEGAARKAEIEIEEAPDGRLEIAAPLEREGEVVGMVAVRAAKPATGPRRAVSLDAVLAFLVPVALFWLAARWIGERRGPLLATAAVLLVAAIAFLGVRAVGALGDERRAGESAVASAAEAEAARATRVLPELEPIPPASIDVDVYRRPYGGAAAGTSEAEARLARDTATTSGAVLRTALGIGIFAFAVLAFFGLGAASRLGATLRRHREAYLYVLPAMLGMIVLVFFPFLYGVALSFTDSTLFNTDKSIPEIWVGLRNYGEILGDFAIVKETAAGTVVNYLNFYWTFFNTVLWTVLNVAIGVSVGLFLALILNTRGLKMRPIYRVLLILPWAMPNYITALIWRGMFHQQFGVINQVIQIFGGPPISWFDNWTTSFLTALATNGWLSFPFMMVVSLGALQSIPSDLFEAARMDGASRWQQFTSITLPSLQPALIPAIILSVIWTFNMFNIIYLVTQGEPGSSTEILITQSYKYAFERYRYGYAAAYSTVIFMILLIYGWWQNRVTRATEGIA
ncbi:MAG TPA: sugar ABC transporter permease [Candidatus Eisenbacteria bacterium]|nr:sugar ABC transporter permease [Candidatus Eisenbacteria bacterium]